MPPKTGPILIYPISNSYFSRIHFTKLVFSLYTFPSEITDIIIYNQSVGAFKKQSCLHSTGACQTGVSSAVWLVTSEKVIFLFLFIHSVLTMNDTSVVLTASSWCFYLHHKPKIYNLIHIIVHGSITWAVVASFL